MTSRGFRVLLGILAFVLLYLVALALSIPKIENNLTSSVTEQLVAGGVTGVAVTFSGRDGTMTGPLATKDAALAAVTDQWGIRSLTYTANGADVVVPTHDSGAGDLDGRGHDHLGGADHHRRRDHDDGRRDHDHRRADDDHRRGSHLHRCNRNHLRSRRSPSAAPSPRAAKRRRWPTPPPPGSRSRARSSTS